MRWAWSLPGGGPRPSPSPREGPEAHRIKAAAAGTVHWNQPLTVTAQLKSLPSGELQNEPDGTQISVQDTAAKMISVSDNTAANMLINLVGRPAVEAALTTTGMADPALDRPFLTTRELFILKLDQWPALGPPDRHLAWRLRSQGARAHRSGRRRLGPFLPW
jgi:beta-lactamase class A